MVFIWGDLVLFVGDIYLYVINCNMSGEIGAKYGEKLAVKSDVDDENRSKIGFLFYVNL